MKVTLYLSSFALLGGLLSACYSNKMLVDDDVYVMKNSELPVGEALTDETNYATYKYKQEKNLPVSAYYYDPYNIAAMNNCDCNPFYFTPFDCGWGARNYGSTGLYDMYYGYGYFNAFGHYYMNPSMNYGANQYGYYGNMYSPYYNPYGGFYFGNSYNSPYFFGNNNFYGNNPYFYSNGNNNGTNSGTVYNSHAGPRGSMSGISNPENRLNSAVLKTPASIQSSNGSSVVSRPFTNKSIAGEQNVMHGKIPSDLSRGTVPTSSKSDLKATQPRPNYSTEGIRNNGVSNENTTVRQAPERSTTQSRQTSDPANRGTSNGNMNGGNSQSGGSSKPSPGVRRN